MPTNFNLNNLSNLGNLSNLTHSTNLSGLAAGTTIVPVRSERIVELAEKPAIAKVVRDGFQVPQVMLDPQKADFFLGDLEAVLPLKTPRVVSQSIRAGTRATAGTVVDLVLAPPFVIPLNIFENVHKDLFDLKVSELLDKPLLKDAKVRETLLQYDNVDNIPKADRDALTLKFQAADIHIDEAAAATSFAAAFSSARGALAFR